MDPRKRQTPTALPIHARRAFVGPDLRPGRRQRLGREHLIHQTEPFAAFDAVAQRRQHAFRPDRGFGPRKITLSLSALCSLVGTPDGLLPRTVHRASPFLPTFPRTGLCCPVLSRSVPSGRRPQRYYAGSDSCPARTRRAGLSASFVSPSEHPVPNHVVGPGHRFRSRLSVLGLVSRSGLRHEWAGSPRHAAETGSLSYGLFVRLRLLPTPSRDDAVAFGYMCHDFTSVGLSPP